MPTATTSAPIHLGVDAGNSKTLAVVCTTEGTVLGLSRCGNGDIYGAASTESAVHAVTQAVTDALAQAGVARQRLASAAYRIAGVDWPEDQAFWIAELDRHGLLPQLASVDNDALAAIRCAEPTGVGVGVVAGTGCAISARQRTTCCLCWWIRGPQGAGGLGQDALEAVYASAMGLGPSTRLTADLLRWYSADSVEALLHAFTRRSSEHPDTAQAGPLVSAAAYAGDAVAHQIIDQHARRLAAYARVAGERAGHDATDPMPVVLTGSVLAADYSPLAAALALRLGEQLPNAQPRPATLPPVGGAALDAIAESGREVTRAIMDRLGQTLSAKQCRGGS